MPSGHEAVKQDFMRWQCRCRQIAMREAAGRPDASISPLVRVDGDDRGYAITTLMIKDEPFSLTPEIKHIARATFDPAQRREKAVTLFSSAYFQKAEEFVERLFAIFSPDSAFAQKLLAADQLELIFDAYSQHYELTCAAEAVALDSYEGQTCFWHNYTYNPNLHRDALIIAFQPKWELSSKQPLSN